MAAIAQGSAHRMATTARAPRGRGRRAFALFLAYLLAIFHPSIASPFRASSPTPSATGISAAVVVLVGGLLGRKRLRDNVASSELVSPTLAHIEKISGTPLPVWFLNEYMSLQARVSAELAFEPTFARPAPKPPKTSSGADNNKFIKDPSERLVYVPPDTRNRRLAHFNKSLAAEVPQLEWQRRYTLPPACKQAISVMLRKQAGLRKWRERKAAALRGVARQARTLDRHLKALPIASVSVTHLERRVRSVNVTMLCLFVDALRHPDTRLPCCFLTGFNVCGVIEPSNVLRPIPPESSLDDFWLGYNDTMNSNNDWAVAVAKSVTAEARTARGEHLSLLHQCWQLTRKEHDAGLAGKPMTLSELQLKYGRGPHMRCRVIRRHAVKQGQKQMRDDNGNVLRNSDGSARMQDKIRLIDNCKTSLHNTRLQHCAETIAPCNFAYMAHVCEEIRSQAIARGLRHMPQVVFSLDDQFQAYRQIPTADPEMCIVCVYSFDSANPGPRFVEFFGHNFGQRSSVINYYRCPTLCCQIMRHFFAVPQESYFDDFNTPDFKLDDQRDSGAAMALSVLHNDLLGLRLESTKHQPADVHNVFLGVTCDVSHAGAADPYVEFRPSPRRVDNILNMLNFGAHWGLPSHAASVLYGKLGFLLQAAYGRVGRAAIQPLVWRQSEETSAWTPSLHRMKMFLDTLLPRLPPLRWYLARPRRRNC